MNGIGYYVVVQIYRPSSVETVISFYFIHQTIYLTCVFCCCCMSVCVDYAVGLQHEKKKRNDSLMQKPKLQTHQHILPKHGTTELPTKYQFIPKKNPSFCQNVFFAFILPFIVSIWCHQHHHHQASTIQ